MVHQNGPTTNPIRVPRTRIVLVELGIDSTLFFPERQKIIDLFSKSFDHDTENREIDEKRWKWTSYANRTVKINCPEKCNADVKTSDYHLVQKRFDPNWERSWERSGISKFREMSRRIRWLVFICSNVPRWEPPMKTPESIFMVPY